MLAFFVRYALHKYVEPHAPFQMFLAACVLTEYLVGFGPAVFSAALGMGLGAYYFVPPYRVFDGIAFKDVIVMINYALVTMFMIVLVEYLRRTLYSNHLLFKVSESRHKISLLRENDRLYLAKKASSAARPLEKMLTEFDKVLLLKLPGGGCHPQQALYRLAASGESEVPAQEWMHLFHPDDRTSLQEYLNSLEEIRGSGKSLQLRLTCGEKADSRILISADRIMMGGMPIIAVKLADAHGNAVYSDGKTAARAR